METLFDANPEPLLSDHWSSLVGPKKKEYLWDLKIYVVGSEERPASQEDIVRVSKELLEARIEGRPVVFDLEVKSSIIPRGWIADTIFGLGSENRPASLKDVETFKKTLNLALEQNLGLIVAGPLSIRTLL